MSCISEYKYIYFIYQKNCQIFFLEILQKNPKKYIWKLFIIMEVYKNRSGRSSVYAYIIGEDFISIQFKTNGKVYKYSYARAGRENVERMKALARNGLGLNTYIKNYVDKGYG